jgi:hypothetical protein
MLKYGAATEAGKLVMTMCLSPDKRCLLPQSARSPSPRFPTRSIARRGNETRLQSATRRKPAHIQ